MNLLPGEASMFELRPVEQRASTSDDAINERYSRGEVRIVTEQARYPLTSIPNMVESSDYELNPEFQRRHRWDIARKSRLIESFIMNVPIPPIFLYEAKYSFYEVMDGLQRLTAIRDFYRDDYALSGLHEWAELNGRTYSELPNEVRRGVDRRYLSSIILLHETAKSEPEALRLKQLVFERINSGGERLTAQESRNAIWSGPMNDLCIRLSRSEHLCKLWHIPLRLNEDGSMPTDVDGSAAGQSLFKTMGDVELVLRFFAYRQQLDHQEGRTLRDYLDDYLRQGNLLDHSNLDQLGEIFSQTIALVYEVLGERAFYLYKKVKGASTWRYTRPTLTVYDPLMWAFSNHLADASELLRRKSTARAYFESTFQDNPASFSGRTAEHIDIRLRNQLFLDLISKTLSTDPDGDSGDELPIDVDADWEDDAIGPLLIDELDESERSTSGLSDG